MCLLGKMNQQKRNSFSLFSCKGTSNLKVEILKNIHINKNYKKKKNEKIPIF